MTRALPSTGMLSPESAILVLDSLRHNAMREGFDEAQTNDRDGGSRYLYGACRTYHLEHGSTSTVQVKDDGVLSFIHGRTDGYALHLKGDVAGIWIPVRGELQIHTGTLLTSVATGEILVTEFNSNVAVYGHQRPEWVALVGGAKLWRQILGTSRAIPALGSELIPSRHLADRALMDRARELARAVDTMEHENCMSLILSCVVALQRCLQGSIDCCSGRTRRARKETYLRLQRAREFIGWHCEQEIDVTVLARIAACSPKSFVHRFTKAFQESPHTYLLNQRLQRAHALLQFSNLTIEDVAAASGFANFSAFGRLFLLHFGFSAADVRRRQTSFELRTGPIMPAGELNEARQC